VTDSTANTSIFSMQKAVEMDVVVKNNPEFINAVKKTVDLRMSQGRKVESVAELGKYNKVTASLQQLSSVVTLKETR